MSTDTLYVDISRYAAQPVQTIKSLLAYWFRKAVWHRPAILILDNLEKLVGVELEVSYQDYQCSNSSANVSTARRLFPDPAHH